MLLANFYDAVTTVRIYIVNVVHNLFKNILQLHNYNVLTDRLSYIVMYMEWSLEKSKVCVNMVPMLSCLFIDDTVLVSGSSVEIHHLQLKVVCGHASFLILTF